MLPFTNETLYDRLPDEGREVDFLPFSNLDESVREGVRRIGQSPLLPDDFGVTGFVYERSRRNVARGRVRAARGRDAGRVVSPAYNRTVRTMNEVHESTSCSVAACAEILGAKWTALLIHDLSEGPRRFSALRVACPGISPRTLSERLRELEQAELVTRRSYAESPPRVEYELTDKGRGLLPIIDEMRRFGHDWLAV